MGKRHVALRARVKGKLFGLKIRKYYALPVMGISTLKKW